MLKKFIILLAILALFGCSQEQADKTTTPQNTSTTQTEQHGGEYLLVFFLNPNGGPCRMQADILNQMSGELDGKVIIRPVKTNVDADSKLFYAYGIRGLPMLLLADRSGKEIRRLPPGVHRAETIRELLKLIPKG
jgi:thioredoxin 1